MMPENFGESFSWLDILWSEGLSMLLLEFWGQATDDL